MSAAIIDDVIGIIVLTFVIGFKKSGFQSRKCSNFYSSVLPVCKLVSDLYCSRYSSIWITNIRIQDVFLFRSGALFYFRLCSRGILRYCGYYRCLRGRYYPVFYSGFGIHSREDGYQFLYDLRTDFSSQVSDLRPALII